MHVTTQPIAIVDVHYGHRDAAAACIVAREWTDDAPSEQHVALVPAALPYEPGAFFKRELPCILQVLSLMQSEYRAIVIDGYVELDEQGTPGLGGHLHAHYRGALPVIGVAKTAYRGSSFAAAVLRGESRSPLFVTARGVPLQEAANLVQRMHGPHRIPTLIQHVDALARAAASKPQP